MYVNYLLKNIGEITMKTYRNNRTLIILAFTAFTGCGAMNSASKANPIATVEFLNGREWLLEDLGGHGELDRVQEALKFHKKIKFLDGLPVINTVARSRSMKKGNSGFKTTVRLHQQK
ncbi:hypothetical protein GO003_003305 [Methylicorpusculum oleiharenae]|nr:hypothetical protein [Methylicorpusculum oleiharenae]MCD2449415.1 hypothetical protein [Methylicorpusculum oleiharenae]